MLFAATLLLVATSSLAEYSHYPIEHESHSYEHDHEMKYHGPPAPLKHDGTVDYTPEVKHARAAHFAALEAYKQSFPHGHHQYHSSPAHITNDHFYHGSVDDLPEVKAARTAHLSEYAQVLHKRHRRSISHGAPLNHDGTVAETPEVKHAKAVHFAAIAEARSYSGHDAPYFSHESAPGYSHGGYKKYFEPAPLNHDGTVADTDDVKHAKAILYKAHSEAKARVHHSSPHYTVHQYPSHHEHSDHTYTKKYHGPSAPLNHDGTVAETPEVKNAKAVHFHLYNQALHRYRRDVHFQPSPLNHVHFQPAPLNPDGTVAETPEVQKATQAFLAAHAAESAQADHSWVEPQHYDEPKYQNHVGHHYQHTTPSVYSEPKSKPILEEQGHHYTPVQHYSRHYVPTVQHYSNHHEPIVQHSKHFEPAPLNHDGTVADTPAIKAAKAVHFAAYQEAHSRIIPHKYSHPIY